MREKSSYEEAKNKVQFVKKTIMALQVTLDSLCKSSKMDLNVKDIDHAKLCLKDAVDELFYDDIHMAQRTVELYERQPEFDNYGESKIEEKSLSSMHQYIKDVFGKEF